MKATLFFFLSLPHLYLPRFFQDGTVFYDNKKLLFNIFTMISILKLKIYFTV